VLTDGDTFISLFHHELPARSVVVTDWTDYFTTLGLHTDRRTRKTMMHANGGGSILF